MATTKNKGLSYAAPKLTVYGEMMKLTASGTQNNPENSGNTTTDRITVPQP